MNDEIFKKEEEVAKNRREYLGEKRLNQEILEPLQRIPDKESEPGNSEIMMCPTDDMIQDFPERFG